VNETRRVTGHLAMYKLWSIGPCRRRTHTGRLVFSVWEVFCCTTRWWMTIRSVE
jgi:hypothetical protein